MLLSPLRCLVEFSCNPEPYSLCISMFKLMQHPCCAMWSLIKRRWAIKGSFKLISQHGYRVINQPISWPATEGPVSMGNAPSLHPFLLLMFSFFLALSVCCFSNHTATRKRQQSLMYTSTHCSQSQGRVGTMKGRKYWGVEENRGRERGADF